MRRAVFSILVDNSSGVLSRVAGLFSRRGYNIDSLTVGETLDPKLSRMTITVTGDDDVLEQIEKQLGKLIDVKEIVELPHDESVCRELVLIKVLCTREERQQITTMADIYRANIVDVAKNSLIISLTGSQSKIDSFIELLDGFKITENYESGGAGLAGTVDAYSLFADALCNGGVGVTGKRILGEKMIRLFMTGYTTGIMQDDFVVTGKKGYRYGLGVRVLNDTAESKSPVGEFGWDGAAGAYVMIDPVNHISIFYAQHIVGFPKVYSEIHPVIRDLVYEALEK